MTRIRCDGAVKSDKLKELWRKYWTVLQLISRWIQWSWTSVSGFVDAGFELSLVGGPVRDLFLGRVSPDLDFTTDATPDQTLSIIKRWADNFWEIGRAFGTIGMKKSGFQIEITTYRAEAYDADSRKPAVAFGSSLLDDLLRRDFTINAMALRLPVAGTRGSFRRGPRPPRLGPRHPGSTRSVILR